MQSGARSLPVTHDKIAAPTCQREPQNCAAQEPSSYVGVVGIPHNRAAVPRPRRLPSLAVPPYNAVIMHVDCKRASLQTIGCRLNQAETAILADRLRKKGYALVEAGEPTDLLVVNTCSVTEQAEKDCRYIIRRTLRHSPHAFVAVTGCYAQTGLASLQQVPGIDLILGSRYKMDLPDYLPSPPALTKQPDAEVLHTRTLDRDEFVLPGAGEHHSTRANLKIQDGCDFMCAFCLIPYARGRERSRRLDDTLREAEALASRGHREVILTGVNLGRYESHGARLVELIRRLESVPGIERIRISSIEPTTIPLELLEYMGSSSKLCRHLHVPLQSGDDGILQAMNRRYSVSAYAALVDRAMRIPDLCLGTDVLVGFPGEDEPQFANTYAVVRDLPFAYCHVFSYSSRPGTPAARLVNAPHPSRVKPRQHRMAELSRAKRMGFLRRYVDQHVSVLFEAREGSGRWTGLTNNYLRVGVSARSDLFNQIREVRITGVMDGLALGELRAAEHSGMTNQNAHRSWPISNGPSRDVEIESGGAVHVAHGPRKGRDRTP